MSLRQTRMALRAALLSVVLVAATTVAAAEPLKVFVFTNDVPGGAVDEQLQARRESLRDLLQALSGSKYQGLLTVVKSRERADLIVELVSRGETTTRAANSSTREAGGATASASRSSSVTKRFLKFRISVGLRTYDLTTEGQLPWPQMAERAADDLARWITTPRSRG